MHEIFNAILGAVRPPSSPTHRSLKDSLRLLKAVRREISEHQPGLFTSEMLWIRVKAALPEITRHEVRQVCNSLAQEGSIAEVGWIRQGHVQVPAYASKEYA